MTEIKENSELEAPEIRVDEATPGAAEADAAEVHGDSEADGSGLPPADLTRAELAWAVIAFQLKLVADGMRDVLLSPLSIGAAVLGIIEGGETPGRYYRKVIAFGRRTERWINLFGRHERDTADDLLRPLEQRFHDELSGQQSRNVAAKQQPPPQSPDR